MAVMIVMDFQGWISSEQPQNLEGIWREGWDLRNFKYQVIQSDLVGMVKWPF